MFKVDRTFKALGYDFSITYLILITLAISGSCFLVKYLFAKTKVATPIPTNKAADNLLFFMSSINEVIKLLDFVEIYFSVIFSFFFLSN